MQKRNTWGAKVQPFVPFQGLEWTIAGSRNVDSRLQKHKFQTLETQVLDSRNENSRLQNGTKSYTLTREKQCFTMRKVALFTSQSATFREAQHRTKENKG